MKREQGLGGTCSRTYALKLETLWESLFYY